MEKLTIKLDQQTSKVLTDMATKELRPIRFQAELALRRGLGLEDSSN